MASCPPPFQVEDQTDEDFFDKLVDDDFGLSESGSKFNEGNDSDDDKPFPNLTMADVASVDEDSGGRGWSEAKNEKRVEGFTAEERRSSLPSNSIGLDNTIESSNDGEGSKLASDLTAGTSNGLGGSGVKVIGWNSFYADSAQKGDRGFGSYSDFFSELGCDSTDFPSNMGENLTAEAKTNYGNEEHKPESLNELINHADCQGGEAYGGSVDQNTNGKDPNSTEYWESLYPGWKYDSNTGQWYQVGAEAFDVATNAHGGFGAEVVSESTAVSDVKSEVSYMQQSLNSVVGTATETNSTSDNVSNWNQISQENNGYPEHIVFDPQYPGWYYDQIVQEWRTLDSYNSSVQSTAQDRSQQNQNGFNSSSFYSHSDNNLYGEYRQANDYGSQNIGSSESHNQPSSWVESCSNSNQPTSNLWQAEAMTQTSAHTTFEGNQYSDHSYSSNFSANSDQQKSFNSFGAVPSHNKSSHAGTNGGVGLQNCSLDRNLSQPFNQANSKLNEQTLFSNDYYGSHKSVNFAQQSIKSSNQFPCAPNVGRSSAGRPPHALVTFGFGGKLIVMKDSSNVRNSSHGSQDLMGGSVSVLNLIEVIGNADASSRGMDSCSYFHALFQQSFPGPLVGGNVGTKDLSKWIDERIANCESHMDYRKGEVLKLLLSLLKIACQHYGKLRSPFGSDAVLKENDNPESAVAKLFSSTKRGGAQVGDNGVVSHCLRTIPSEGQIRATASEVQNILVSGRKKEALQCAKVGQLWGPALVLASQLGDQFYVETVKQMALQQLVAGSPLRTLCLLIAGKPAEVFSTDTTDSSLSGVANMPHQPAQFAANVMLDDWEENLAVISANRTKDDELVIIHLGDCLWKERNEIAAAHICYLVAEANFESYSDSARLCLIGADHWKFPRTYTSPEAIQRTELYEYSKVLGNSQFILLPFQPYKLIYAHMLAEIGKVSDSLKYCQAILKSLKTGRAPEVETWKQLVLSLDERIRAHQQGGYTTNLAPGKLVGKLLNFFDSTAHRVVGGLPPPAPSTLHGSVQGNEHFHQPMSSRVSSQSTMAMSALIPSASMEPISEWASAGNKMTMHNRSVSEPDFGRTPRQETNSPATQGKASSSGGASRFHFGFGSQLLQKTVGIVLGPRSGRQAKLGEKNKFYFDEKLKRWVEEGSEPPAEEAALPPPPTTAPFQNGFSDYNFKSVMKKEGCSGNGHVDLNTSVPSEPSSGVPPIPPTSSQFSSRGRMGVRSRYVDTFNPAGGSPAKLFQSPSVPSLKPATTSNAKFFIPTPTSGEKTMESIAESVQEDNVLAHGDTSASTANDSFHSPTPSSTMQRFLPSMSNIASKGAIGNGYSSLPPHSCRTAPWSGGSFNDSFSPPKETEVQSLGEVLDFSPASSMPSEAPHMQTQMNGSSNISDNLHELEL